MKEVHSILSRISTVKQPRLSPDSTLSPDSPRVAVDLTALDASFNFVAPGWHFASMLEENATLRSLNLSGTGLDDAGLKPI